ncbi:YceI family protein [Xanthomonadaceae bacterium JHOS43]|nr:YceI family protein [Xanthomonadaceae bacterium JHOS43]MCX7564408.1 YceI family protein [Xanthomonadaceae bacterium XH05]
MNPRFLFLTFLVLATSADAKPVRYELDPVHSRIVFSVGHDGYSSALGTLSRPQGELWFDPDDWRSARLEVCIDLTTLDLGNGDINARIARRDYLDTQRHPYARFVSSSVEPRTATRADVHGTLSLRGNEVPVTLEVTLNRIARSAYTLRRTAGFSAKATLRRSAFGMTAHPRAVDDSVHLRIEAEAVRRRGQAEAPTPHRKLDGQPADGAITESSAAAGRLPACTPAGSPADPMPEA